MTIHPTAIIDPQANVHDTAIIGPYAIIGPEVSIGAATEILPHSVITGPTTIGEKNTIGPMATIGAPPQDLKYAGEPTRLEIGDNNIIREYVTIHRGTTDGNMVTKMGSHCLLMASSHVAHDCTVGDQVIMANAASLAGHVSVGDGAVLGGFVAVHQFCRLGKACYVGGMSGITRDIPPFVLAEGTRSQTRVARINSIGLRRSGMAPKNIAMLEQAFQIIFRENFLLVDALKKTEETLGACPEVMEMVTFFRESKRGVVRTSNGGAS